MDIIYSYKRYDFYHCNIPRDIEDLIESYDDFYLDFDNHLIKFLDNFVADFVIKESSSTNNELLQSTGTSFINENNFKGNIIIQNKIERSSMKSLKRKHSPSFKEKSSHTRKRISSSENKIEEQKIRTVPQLPESRNVSNSKVSEVKPIQMLQITKLETVFSMEVNENKLKIQRIKFGTEINLNKRKNAQRVTSSAIGRIDTKTKNIKMLNNSTLIASTRKQKKRAASKKYDPQPIPAPITEEQSDYLTEDSSIDSAVFQYTIFDPSKRNFSPNPKPSNELISDDPYSEAFSEDANLTFKRFNECVEIYRLFTDKRDELKRKARGTKTKAELAKLYDDLDRLIAEEQQPFFRTLKSEISVLQEKLMKVSDMLGVAVQ